MNSQKESENVKSLAIAIADFLLTQSTVKFDALFTRRLRLAVDCLEKVYSIHLRDYLLRRNSLSLPEMFKRASNPVSIKNQLQAEQCKLRGNRFLYQERYTLAEAEYTKAIRLNDLNPVYFCNRADSRIRQGRYKMAVEDCQKTLSLDPHYAKAYARLGTAYFMMNHPAKAARCYKKALKIEPKKEIYLKTLGYITQPTNRCGFEILNPLHRLKKNFVSLASNFAPLRGVGDYEYHAFTNETPALRSPTILQFSETID
ncbi:small glutamine-rich tetratricopeptide repeat-containing protein 2 [Trichonephila inaurata madagascariensis]|uniref:Small glutamine-rich tetratricopeptide repeat-containing protein 2 n=1 Tax=Trichonephila inaurata madagascariensis TaxID=2747483 RepID=A0A8X6X2Q6_9ARAC|nr:small glutamine-rich tetratricopeptide repeat-containing protein 2 [Trichonephila inaurata madagascariensis]